MRRLILALVGLSSAGMITTACIAPHVPPPAVTAVDLSQLASLAGAMADYGKTDKITVVRDEHGKPVSFRFNGR
jgi:hypothetical protein